MKLLKNQSKNKIRNKAEEKAEGEMFFQSVDGKQIISHARIVNPNETGQNVYGLEDDTEIFQDDKGKALKEIKIKAKKVKE